MFVSFNNDLIFCFRFSSGSRVYSRELRKSTYYFIFCPLTEPVDRVREVDNSTFCLLSPTRSIKPFAQTGYVASAAGKPTTAVSSDLQPPPTLPPWEGRSIATPKLRLVEFSAFMEHHTEPDTVSVP